MRRFVSGICLTLMFFAVSFAQTAWWLSQTVFDTGAFRDAVRSVAAEPDVRAALGDDVAGVVSGGRDLSPKQSSELRSAVDDSVAGQPFADELADTLATVHAALLAGRNPAAALDLAAVQDDVRAALEATDPRLAAAVPDGRLQRRVDPGRLPWVPRVVDGVGTAVPLLVLASLLLLAVAVLVARDRPRTMRRAGYVLLASTAFTLVTRFVVPVLAVPLLPAGVVRTLGGALASYLLGALVPPLVVTAVVAVGLVAAGFAWGRARSRPRIPLQAPPPRYTAPAPPVAASTGVLPVGGPPVANPAVVSPAPAIPPVLVQPTAVQPAAVQPTAVQPAAVQPAATAPMPQPEVPDAAETVEDPRGWGPLRY